MDFIYRTEFEGVKILFWQLKCKFLLIFIKGLRWPYSKGLVGHCTSGHSLNPPDPTRAIAIPSGGSRWGWGRASSHRYRAIFARAKYRQRHSLYVRQFVTTRNVTFYCLCCCTRFLEHCMRPLECVISVLILFDFGCEFLLGSFAHMHISISIQYDLHSSVLKPLMIGVVCKQHSNT